MNAKKLLVTRHITSDMTDVGTAHTGAISVCIFVFVRLFVFVLKKSRVVAEAFYHVCNKSARTLSSPSSPSFSTSFALFKNVLKCFHIFTVGAFICLFVLLRLFNYFFSLFSRQLKCCHCFKGCQIIT